MSKIKRFDYMNVTEMYEEVDKALVQIAKKFGISLQRGKVKYSDVRAVFFVTANVVGKDGEVKTPEVEDWNRHHKVYGFAKEDLGRQFQCGGKIFTIAGLMPRKPKYPILATNVNGRRFKFPAAMVKNNLISQETSIGEEN